MKSGELGFMKPRGKLSLSENKRRITLIALFGVAVFISKVFLPSPMDKMLVAVQALFLSLGSLLSRPFGATLVAVIGATLTIFLRPSLAPLTILFALLYGLLIDGLIFIFHVRASGGDVRVRRLAAAVTISTAITGLVSYSVTVHVLALLPRNPILEVAILVVGVISGLLGGYLAGLIWRKALRHILP